MEPYFGTVSSNNRRVDSSSNACKDVPSRNSSVISSQVQLRETRSSYTLTLHVPGFRKEDVKVEMDSNRVLVVKAQRQDQALGLMNYAWRLLQPSQNSTRRPFKVPLDVNVPAISVTFHQGYLQVVMPKVKGSERYSPYNVCASHGRRASRSIPRDGSNTPKVTPADKGEVKPGDSPLISDSGMVHKSDLQQHVENDSKNDSEMRECEQRQHNIEDDSKGSDKGDNQRMKISTESQEAKESPEVEMRDTEKTKISMPTTVSDIDRKDPSAKTEEERDDHRTVHQSGDSYKDEGQMMKMSTESDEIKEAPDIATRDTEDFKTSVRIIDSDLENKASSAKTEKEETNQGAEETSKKSSMGTVQTKVAGEAEAEMMETEKVPLVESEQRHDPGGAGRPTYSEIMSMFDDSYSSLLGVFGDIAQESKRLVKTSTAKMVLAGLVLSTVVFGAAKKLARR